MIKNDIQLKRAESRFKEIGKEIEEYQQKFSGIERDLYILPLMDEENQLEDEIDEYLKLKNLPFEEAIKGPLGKPILIDNISELLAKLRIASKLTQEELAARLGWEQSNLSRFESENYSSQTISKTVELASELGIWLYVFPSLTEEIPKIIYKKDTVSRPISILTDTTTKPTRYHDVRNSAESYPVRKELSKRKFIRDTADICLEMNTENESI